jgi:protein-disulfide isomerase
MRKIWFPLLALFVFAWIAPAPAQSPPRAPASAADMAKFLPIGPDDRMLGNADATVTIVEYASLTCPHCRHFEVEVLPKLKEKWIDTGKAKLVLRDFPLDEPALRAAMVARCAPPDRYYAFIDTLFKSQEEWATARDYKAALQRIAQLGGISKKDFTACMENKSVENKVVESRFIAAEKLGVEATPSFFVNGSKFDGAPTFEAFDQLLSSLAPKS